MMITASERISAVKRVFSMSSILDIIERVFNFKFNVSLFFIDLNRGSGEDSIGVGWWRLPGRAPGLLSKRWIEIFHPDETRWTRSSSRQRPYAKCNFHLFFLHFALFFKRDFNNFSLNAVAVQKFADIRTDYYRWFDWTFASLSQQQRTYRAFFHLRGKLSFPHPFFCETDFLIAYVGFVGLQHPWLRTRKEIASRRFAAQCSIGMEDAIRLREHGQRQHRHSCSTQRQHGHQPSIVFFFRAEAQSRQQRPNGQTKGNSIYSLYFLLFFPFNQTCLPF